MGQFLSQVVHVHGGFAHVYKSSGQDDTGAEVFANKESPFRKAANSAMPCGVDGHECTQTRSDLEKSSEECPRVGRRRCNQPE
jgi:hypothetical protein